MTIITSSQSGKFEVAARPTITVGRRLATAAFVASLVIVGVLGWRWALVEATTDYGPEPDAHVTQPAASPVIERAPAPVAVEVTVLDVHTAAPPSPKTAPTKARPSAPSSRPRPPSKSAQ